MTIGLCVQLSIHYPLMAGGEAGSGSGKVSALSGAGGGRAMPSKGPGQWKPTHMPAPAVTRSQLRSRRVSLPCLPCDCNTTSKKPPRLCVCCTHPDNNHLIPLPLPSSTSPFSPLQRAAQPQHTFSFLYRNHHLYPRLSPLTVITVNYLSEVLLAVNQVQTAPPTSNSQCRTTIA